MNREILTAEQLAERWQVKTAWIYAKTRSGDIPRVPLPGRYYRYRLDVIERFERGELDSGRWQGVGWIDMSMGAAPLTRPAPGAKEDESIGPAAS